MNPSTATAGASPAKSSFGPDREARARRLFLRYRRFGDANARAKLIELYMPLARRLARRYSNSSEPFEDLLQVASVGLILAIDRFDPERGTHFAGFATPTISGELKRHFRDNSWGVHVPRALQDRAVRVRNVLSELPMEPGRATTPKQVAEQCGLSIEEATEAIEAWKAYAPDSLEAPDPARPRWDRSGAEDPAYSRLEEFSVVAAGIAALSSRERVALGLRFIADMSQDEIADRIGVSQMHVSRLLKRSIDRLAVVADARR